MPAQPQLPKTASGAPLRRGLQGGMLALTLAVLACQAPQAAPQAPGARSTRLPGVEASRVPSALAGGTAPGLASPAPAASGAPTPVLAGSPEVMATATLAGKVRLPASIVSNNGGSVAVVNRLISDKGLGIVSNNGGNIVSNNGGNVVSNNGAGYRVTALPEELPGAGLTVQLLDATGAVVLGADGQPLETVTDEAGQYTFRVPIVARTYLVSVALPGKGEAAALVPRDALVGEGSSTVDVDLVSTYATGYVYNAYVRPQADPQAALELLSSAVDTETRERTRAALAATAEPPPLLLTRDGVMASVSALRDANPGLNRQLTSVRCLVVAAGSCELPEGALGTEVSVGAGGMVLTPDGALYVNDINLNMVWRLDPDGRVRSVFQGAAAGADGLYLPRAVALDAAGRVLLLDIPGAERRLSRLEHDGRLVTLWSGAQDPRAVLGGPGDAALVLQADGQFLLVAAGAPAQPVHTVSGADLTWVRNATGVGGSDPGGSVYLSTSGAEGRTAVRLDAATLEMTRVPIAADGDEITGIEVDVRGHVFVQRKSRALDVIAPGEPARRLMAALPREIDVGKGVGVAYAGDGVAYLGSVDGVFRIADRAAARVFGAMAFKPYGLAVGTDGTLYVGEGMNLFEQATRLFRIAPGKVPQVLVGKGASGAGGSQAPGFMPTVRLGPGDVPHVLEQETANAGLRIRRLGAGGALEPVYEAPAGTKLDDFVFEPAGTMLVVSTDATGQRILRVAADGTATTLFGPEVVAPLMQVATAPGGGLYLAAGGALRRWTEGEPMAVIASHAAFDRIMGMGVAPDGRVYTRKETGAIGRFDPASSAVDILDGPLPTLTPALRLGGGPVFGPDGRMYVSWTFAGQVLQVGPGEY